MPVDVIRQISATQLCPDHPITDIAVSYFRRLAARPGMFDRPGGELVSQPAFDLLRAVITTHLDAVDLRFSLSQAEEIRQTIGAAPLPVAAAPRGEAAADTHVGLLATRVDA